MKNNTVFAFIMILILALFAGCSMDSGPTSYSIGDTGPSGVGIVYYTSDGGLHGLEAAPSGWAGGSDDPTIEWISGGSTQTTANGNTLTSIGTGLDNSESILAQSGHTSSASQICRNYNGGGRTDWFLPSKDELSQLYLQMTTVGGFNTATESRYWSSSEADALNAHGRDFASGTESTYGKGNPRSVRAVRTF